MKIYRFLAFAGGEDWLEVFYVENNLAARADFIQRMHDQYEIDLECDRKEMLSGCEISGVIYRESIQERLETHEKFDLIAKSFIPHGVYDENKIRYYLIRINEVEVLNVQPQSRLSLNNN